MSVPGAREILVTEFDVEDAIGRRATNRGEDPEAGEYRVLVVPVWIDGVVVGCPRQANVGEGAIRGRELSVTVGRQIHRVKRLVIQTVRERQCHGGGAVVAMVADVRVARDDTGLYLFYVVMVLRRATFHCVTAREGRVRIAERVGDRSGGNAGSHAPPEIEMQHEPGSHVSVDHLDTANAAANVAGQHQIARLD